MLDKYLKIILNQLKPNQKFKFQQHKNRLNVLSIMEYLVKMRLSNKYYMKIMWNTEMLKWDKCLELGHCLIISHVQSIFNTIQ